MAQKNINGWRKHSDVYLQEELDQIYKIKDKRVGITLVKTDELPKNYSLGPYMSKVIEDQGSLGLCFAFAGEGILEFYNKNTPPLGIEEDLSEMFLGYYSRFICEGGPPQGDQGSTILATMQAMQKYGICRAISWPYIVSRANTEPNIEAFNEAKDYKVLTYFGIPNDDKKINTIKKSVYASVPVMFGSMVRESIFDVGEDGIEPYYDEYCVEDPEIGGHARFIYGWDDDKIIPGADRPGAFLVRNSWGPGWGMSGDSWVSYQIWDEQETDDMGITSAIHPGAVNPKQPTIWDKIKSFFDLIKIILNRFF